jgi:hypothetical protein
MMRLKLYIFLVLMSLFGHKALAGAPQQVKVGVYLMNLYGLDMNNHSFYADFYIWFKWKGSIDPTKIEFVNSIEKWSVNNAAFDGDSTPVKLKDGYKYKIFRVESRFFHTFLLNRFPLDEHDLDIQIENPEFPADSLVYVPDTNAADIRKTLHLVGWNQSNCRLVNTIHDYKTDFGNPQENARKYSNIAFMVSLSRPFSYFLLKMLLPIFIVMVVSISALFAHPSYIDTRTSLPIGGLLTAVFLQQTYSDALPDSGYMVLMDKIYLLCYVLISFTLGQIILAGNRLLSPNPDREKQIMRTERQLAALFMLIFILGVFILCAF